MSKITIEFWPELRMTVKSDISAETLRKEPRQALSEAIHEIGTWPGGSTHTGHGLHLQAWIVKIEDQDGTVVYER